MAAPLPALAENALTVLFERTINDTRIFWSQRADGSLYCSDWEWCCPEIPAILAGLEAVVFVTRAGSTARIAGPGVLVVSIDARRVWGRVRSVRAVPRGTRAITWDDRVEVGI